MKFWVITVAIALCCLLSAQVRAQDAGSTPSTLSSFRDGSIVLTVQVVGEDRSVLDVLALVRLRNLTAADKNEKWDTTRLHGEVSFYSLFQGQYVAEVSALGYKTSTTAVDLFGVPTETIRVVLTKDLNTEAYAAPVANASKKARQAAERGLLSLQTGKLKEAENHLRNAESEAPQNAQVNYLLAIVLLQRKQTEEAEKFFREAIELDPKHVPALTALGGLRFEQKDYQAAAALLQRAIAANPRQWRPHWLLANTLLMQRDDQPALAEAQLAVELSKNAAPLATMVLGEALANTGRQREAIDTLQRFLQQAPTSPNAPAVRELLATLQNGPAEGTVSKAVVLNLTGLTSRSSPALALMSPAWTPPGVDDVLPPVAAGVACPLEHVLTGAGQSMVELAGDLDRFSAAETQAYESLDLLGRPITHEIRKSDYLAQLSQPVPGQLQLLEYRRERSGVSAFSNGVLSEGMLGLAFIFHPALRDNFDMVCEGLGEWNHEPAWLVHFRQRPDRPRRVQGFRTGAQNYEIALKGRAWIGAASFKIMRVEAELVEPMHEPQLLLEHQIGNYGPVNFKAKNAQLWLPKDTEIYLQYRGRRFRLTSHYDDFVLFSVDSEQQDKVPLKTDK